MDLHPLNGSLRADFLLEGVPGLGGSQSWLGLPFGLMYALALLGNGALLLALRLSPALHSPMFRLLGWLGAVDLAMASAVTPKMLAIFWADARAIGFDACFAQMFLVHGATAVESGILLAMAIDRYLAICHPLRYETLLTGSRLAGLGLAVLIRALLYMAPLTWMTRRLPYCGSRHVAHSYCEHMAIMQLSCADWSTSAFYNMAGTAAIVGGDTAGIAASYALILRAASRCAGWAERRKAFRTCSAHVGVLMLYYLPGVASVYSQQFPQHVAPPAQVLLADLYLTLPPALNPIIYSIRTEQVRSAMARLLTLGRKAAT